MIYVERTVNSPAAVVWALLRDLERWDQVLPTMDEVRPLDTGPIAVGSRFEVRQPGLRAAVYEVTEWQPERSFTWVASSPGVRTTATHVVEQVGGVTRLALGIRWTGPLAGLVGLVFGGRARRMVEQEGDTFVRLAEGHDAAA
jgi:uncharacterized membrane protein